MSFIYPGSELELIAQASHWNEYRSVVVRPLLGPRMLKVDASVDNRVLLRQDAPSMQQIVTWDLCVVHVSRRLDTSLDDNVGNSFMAVRHCDL